MATGLSAALRRLGRAPGLGALGRRYGDVDRAAGPPSPLGAAAVGAALALLGFVAAGAGSGAVARAGRLASASDAELVATLGELQERTATLQEELTRRELELAARQATARQEEAEADASQREIEDLEVLAGLIGARGPGLLVEITPGRTPVPFELLLDLVQELRDAGAEALAVNDRRLGAGAHFGSRDGLVTVDGQPVRPPYRVVAIGDPATLEGGLRIPGGAVETLEAVDGSKVSLERRREIRVPALAPTGPSGRGQSSE